MANHADVYSRCRPQHWDRQRWELSGQKPGGGEAFPVGGGVLQPLDLGFGARQPCCSGSSFSCFLSFFSYSGLSGFAGMPLPPCSHVLEGPTVPAVPGPTPGGWAVGGFRELSRGCAHLQAWVGLWPWGHVRTARPLRLLQTRWPDLSGLHVHWSQGLPTFLRLCLLQPGASRFLPRFSPPHR